MKTQDNKPLTMEDLIAWEQEIAQAFIERGMKPPIFGDKAGQTTVRFSNKHYKGKTDTTREVSKDDKPMK